MRFITRASAFAGCLLLAIPLFNSANGQRAPDGFMYGGQVVSEEGEPIRDVRVTATYRDVDGSRFGYIDSVLSDASGKFSIKRQVALSGMPPQGLADRSIRLTFRHPDFLDGCLEDVRVLLPGHQVNVQVQLRKGFSIDGQVVDDSGRGMARALVEVVCKGASTLRKATVCNEEGAFEVRGLPHHQLFLSAFANDPKLSIMAGHVELSHPHRNVSVVVKPVIGPKRQTYRCLGMTVVDIDKEIQQALRLGRQDGVLILDPGVDVERFEIGKVEPGDAFSIIGETRVANFGEFVQQLLAESRKWNQRSGEFGSRVVYRFRRPDSAGSNTQFMRLTKGDIAELELVASKQRPSSGQ